jgi:hypothetical protein
MLVYPTRTEEVSTRIGRTSTLNKVINEWGGGNGKELDVK